MTIKELISLLIPLLSFIVVGVLVYWRENRKQFQEKIFEYKFQAYREIGEEVGMYCQDVFNFLDSFQFYEGSKEEWLEESKDEFKEYYAKAFALERLYYKNLILLPDDQLNRLRELTGRCVRHITVHHHLGTDLPHTSYDMLLDMLYEFLEEGRKDLSVNLINSSLNRRLSEQFYPINLKLQRSQKNNSGDNGVDNVTD
ncbi:hypothetical protein [Dyadobacter sp. CY312]|uniref:hypothetical protein n=1 Tax=Dyadobacter sp. CY312 TaxID=2907303 RepID=UPI001F34A74E|nr:hypothetical protein [Dyadobacter sp. CY312]MCE7040083.1 hypothetical protein [Dyadobacter sp. CY312]